MKAINHVAGKAIPFGLKNVDTDVIIPARYLNTSDPAELAKHCLEDLDADFVKKVAPGDIIVADENFGCGSSREHAPIAIKAAGVSVVIASSFARIFYRNAINTGLPVVECDTDLIDDGDELTLDLEAGVLRDVTKGTDIPFAPLPPVMARLLADGGLVEHFKKHGGFALD